MKETKTIREWMDERSEIDDSERLAAINAALVDAFDDILAQMPADDWYDDDLTVTLPEDV